MQTARRYRQIGFSIIELLVGLAVLGIALSVAMPSYSEAKQNQLLSSAAEKFASDIQLWRGSAIKQSKPVVVALAQSNGGQTWCYGASDTNPGGCDCLIATACSVENSSRVVSQADFRNISINISNVPGNKLTLQPRGLIDVANAQVSFTSNSKTIVANIGATGKVALCSNNVTTYKPC